MKRKHTYSLYLAKECVSDFSGVITDTAADLVRRGVAKAFDSKALGKGARLFVFPGHRMIPKWVDPLKKEFKFEIDVFSQSPAAILVFNAEDRFFCLTFSFGHVYLDHFKTESEFGLRVAINSISDKRLRSVERSNIGDAIRDFAQAASQRDLRSFGFGDALDLIRKVSGYSEDADFAETVTGSRALRFSKAIDLKEVPGAAPSALKLFRSNDYKKTAFRIIDFLSVISDPQLHNELDENLVAAIKSGSDEFEIAIPQILPEQIGSFRFERAGVSQFHADLSLEIYRSGLGDNLKKLTLHDLKKHVVTAYSDAYDHPLQSWSVRHALVGSTLVNGKRYALNEGLWYRIDDKFKAAADKEFEQTVSEPDKKLRPLKKIVSVEKRKKTISYQSEQDYNQEISEETGYLLFDRKLIQIEDVPGAGVEACDLLDLDGRRFIHVKKSSRQSSVLSHLFKQGGNAAQLFRKYEPFRSKVASLIEAGYGRKKALEFRRALDDAWTVEFQIADFPRKDGRFNIPFFSKLTLRDEVKNIAAMGFKIRVGFIKLVNA
jgi:uncharacterized protein (TIGR04141 family)